MTTRAKLTIGIAILIIGAAIAGLVGDSSDMNVGWTLVPVDGGRR